MYKIDFNQPCHIHFIGIGGISMSGLAEILLEEGFTVSGSDNKESALTDHLSQNGATVFYGQKASNIIDGIDLVVYTAASPITGTIIDVTFTIRLPPPSRHHPVRTARIPPMIHGVTSA